VLPGFAPLLFTTAAHAAPLHVQGLVVGVDRFASWRVPELAYAVSDAEHFRAALIDNGGGAFSPDDIVLLVDEAATVDTVGSRVQALLADAGDDDVVVLFFSSHGYVVDGRGYLYMHDTTTDTLAESGLSVADLDAWIAASHARHVLLFTDACHAAAVGTLRDGGGLPQDNGFNAVLDSLERSEGSFFNLASSLVQQKSYESWDYCGGGGAFTCALTEALGGAGDLDGDGQVDLAELSTWVQGRVMALTDNLQTPEAKGDYDPELVLAAPGSAALDGQAILGKLGSTGSAPDAPLDGDDFAAVADIDQLAELIAASGNSGSAPGLTDADDSAGGGLVGVLDTSADDALTGGAAVGGFLLSNSGDPDADDGYAYGDPYVDTYLDDSDDWRPPFRVYGGVALAGGVGFGAVSPTRRVPAGSDSLDPGTAPVGLLRLSLWSDWWWLNPGLTLGLQGGRWQVEQAGEAGSRVTQGPVTRLGVELTDTVIAFPYRVVRPYAVGGIGAWGGRWVSDDAGLRYRNDPLAGPLDLGGGVGIQASPWWLGGLTAELEGRAMAPLWGDAAGAVSGRVTLGLQTLL